MANCSKCGAPLEEGATFCGNCGAPVESAPASESVLEFGQTPEPAQGSLGDPFGVGPAPAAPSITGNYQQNNYQQTSYQQAAYNPATTGETPVSLGDWMITMFIAAIPLVGLIMLFVWAFGSETETKSNWAKARLIWTAIGCALSVAMTVLFAGMFAALASYF